MEIYGRCQSWRAKGDLTVDSDRRECFDSIRRTRSAVSNVTFAIGPHSGFRRDNRYSIKASPS